MEERVKFIEHQGQRILVQDLTDSVSAEENMGIFDRTQVISLSQPSRSVRLLTNVTNAHYSSQAVERLKQFSRTITPHMLASAAVGVTGIKKIVLQSLIRLTGRKITLFDTVEQALDWLAEQ
jgi:hypothetical protein